MRFVDLHVISFPEALSRQQETIERISDQHQPDTVYLLEHPHVFTIGRGGKPGNLLADRDWEGNPIQLERINRGGDITYHGPGQLVGYLHLDLRRRGRDVSRFLRDLEQTLIQTSEAFGIRSFRRPGLTGVWTDHGKLASIGVAVRRWITMHGFALNVVTDLRYFQLIHPCGLETERMTSMTDVLGVPVEVGEVKKVFQESFREVFGEIQNPKF